MTARQVTIEDVAHAAGVSRQTVSNALNAPHRLRATTLARVTAAIDELGYQPDQSARSLRTGTRKVIGYPAPADNPADPNPLMGGFLQALVTAADAVGHRILVFRSDPQQGAGAVARSFNGLIAARQVDGFVLSDVVHDDPRVDVLTEAGFPFAAFGRTAPGRPQNWVDIDSTAATAALTGLLLDQGHRRICYLNSAASLPWLADRRAASCRPRPPLPTAPSRSASPTTTRPRSPTPWSACSPAPTARPPWSAQTTGSPCPPTRPSAPQASPSATTSPSPASTTSRSARCSSPPSPAPACPWPPSPTPSSTG